MKTSFGLATLLCITLAAVGCTGQANGPTPPGSGVESLGGSSEAFAAFAGGGEGDDGSGGGGGGFGGGGFGGGGFGGEEALGESTGDIGVAGLGDIDFGGEE